MLAILKVFGGRGLPKPSRHAYVEHRRMPLSTLLEVILFNMTVSLMILVTSY